MASCSCSDQWWRAPIYTTVSMVLAFIAISSAIHSTHHNPTAPSLLAHQLSLNASQALRIAGFSAMAALLPIFPSYFLSTPNSTVFALRDSAVADISRSPWLMKDYLLYHVVPLSLSMDDLLKRPEGSCLPTSLSGNSVTITKIGASQRLITLNSVSVTNPDIFVAETLVIHGLPEPLALPGFQPPACKFDSKISSSINQWKTTSSPIKWAKVVQFLNSRGFVSFSNPLRSALDGILEDGNNLTSVTIFAPEQFSFGLSGLPVLEKIVRFHILPQRYTFSELAALLDKTSLRTLVPGQGVKVTRSGNGEVRVNGVKIEAPDILSTEAVVVHGISKAFDMVGLSNT